MSSRRSRIIGSSSTTRTRLPFAMSQLAVMFNPVRIDACTRNGRKMRQLPSREEIEADDTPRGSPAQSWNSSGHFWFRDLKELFSLPPWGRVQGTSGVSDADLVLTSLGAV